MDDYSLKKKALIEEIHTTTNKDPVLTEYIAFHKELLDTKDKLINTTHFSTAITKLKSLPTTVDDFEISMCHNSGKCPITQGKISDPFYSVCGHVFERMAIKDYLRRGRNTCPYVGCKEIVKEK